MKNKKIILLMWILALIPAVMVLLCWSHLPETVPIHWGLNGQVDGYGDKNNLWLIAGTSACAAPLFQVLPRLDPKKDNYQRFQGAYELVALLVPLLMIFTTAITLTETLRPGTLNVTKAVLSVTSILFIVIGCTMGKLKTNWFVGVRTPWALSDPDVWNKTNRLGGWVFFISGIVTLPLALLVSETAAGIAFVVIIMAGILLTYVMSYLWYKKKVKREE